MEFILCDIAHNFHLKYSLNRIPDKGIRTF